MNWLSLTSDCCTGMAVHFVHLLLVLYCNKVSHELAEEELLSLKVWPVISMSMYLVWQKRETHF